MIPLLAFSSSASVAQFSFESAVSDATALPECRSIEPYYLEMGNAQGKLVSHRLGNDAPDQHTVMPIASASKWIFSAYVTQVRQGNLKPSDIEALTMRSGYTSLWHRSCIRWLKKNREKQTVLNCFEAKKNATYTSQHQGFYFYNGGHYQHLAITQLGLANDNNASLALRFKSTLHIDLAFGSPQLAGGIQTSADAYATFLRSLLREELFLSKQLGHHAICTQPKTCKQALYTPLPELWQWQYSLGHWVETDDTGKSTAYSSPGAYGFYPWIDINKRHYGVIARKVNKIGAAFASASCGKKLREALIRSNWQIRP